MSWISLMYQCPNCKHTFDDLVRRSEREHGTECPICKAEVGQADELVTAPNVLRNSYHMGRKTNIGEQLKEANKLEVAAAGMREGAAKSEVMREVSKIRNPKRAREAAQRSKK